MFVISLNNTEVLIICCIIILALFIYKYIDNIMIFIKRLKEYII